MRRLAVLAVLLTAVAVAASEQEVRTFMIKNRTAKDAIPAVASILSDNGSISLQPSTNTLVVRDTPEVLDRVEGFLATWDVAPGQYRVHVQVFLASDEVPTPSTGAPHFSEGAQEIVKEQTSKPKGPHIATLEERLSKLFPYKYFQQLDDVEAVGTDGSVIDFVVGRRYYLKFVLKISASEANTLQLSGLELTHQRRSGDTAETGRPMLSTSLSMRVGQITVVGAAPSEDAKRALVLVFQGTPETR